MNILLIGANGQLGSDLNKHLCQKHTVTPLTHADLEITDALAVLNCIQTHEPDVVINTAAYHKVDEIENNPSKAFEVNALGARNLAQACEKNGAVLVHFSTDYVFSGKKKSPYHEDDLPGPLNAYGISKLAGEYFIKYSMRRYFIVRTTGLYGIQGSSGKGGNFIELMLRMAREGRDIRVVDDQFLTPTYTVDLAEKVGELIDTQSFGIFHVTNTGYCTWHEFAKTIFSLSGLSPNLSPISTTAFGATAQRPAYSVLAHNALLASGLSDLRPWQESLRAYLQSRNR